jgi:Mg2+-importing ATPase
MQTGTRSPIDCAIVDHLKTKQGEGMFGDVSLADWLKLGELPFESCRRLLSVLVCKAPEKNESEARDALFITKGAVEEVLNSCTRVYDYSTPLSVPETPFLGLPSLAEFDPELPLPSSLLTADKRQSILDTAERLNEDGLRLVAVACKLSVIMKPSTEAIPLFPEDEEDLAFIGFLGFLDPPKAGATNAIAKLNKLNVQVRILTGDSPTVAAKVARDLGILGPRKTTAADTAIIEEPDKFASSSPVGPQGDVCLEMEPVSEKDLIVTGSQLAELSNEEDKGALREVIERGIIFAKLSPHQKLQVVEILRSGGPTGERAVAFLGDGVNDALAIRGADVGISVESGTEVAKEAADVILLEKNLDVVAEGVRQGRIT